MDIDTSVANFRLEHKRLYQLVKKYSSSEKPLPEFITHYEYINSLATSILILSKRPKENVIALTALLRMLLESVGVLHELVSGDTNHKDREKFVKNYERGEEYPKDMSYRKLVSRLPSNDINSSKILIKLYDECSKSIHFSKKSLEILNDIDDPKVVVQWCNTIIKWMSDSYKQQSDYIEGRLAARKR